MARPVRQSEIVDGIPYIHVTELAGHKVDVWMPDIRSEAFKAAARREARLARGNPNAADEQAFVDAISIFPNE